jgi:hypothetical protein
VYYNRTGPRPGELDTGSGSGSGSGSGGGVTPAQDRRATVAVHKACIVYDGRAHKNNFDVYDKQTGARLTQSGNYVVQWNGDGTNIGKQGFTITFKGNYAKTPAFKGTFTIFPGKTSITSAKAAKKKATLKFRALKGGVKYQVAYKFGKSWTYGTSTKATMTVKKLKSKKTYTFKVRAFKVVKGQKYYGAWSATKKLKIK